MRVRFGVGLPGPFYLSSGPRKWQRGNKHGFAVCVLLLIAVAVAVVYWYVSIPLAVLALVIWVVHHRKERQ